MFVTYANGHKKVLVYLLNIKLHVLYLLTKFDFKHNFYREKQKGQISLEDRSDQLNSLGG